MPFYLAVDAGGTKTDYVLADDTTELARVRGNTIKRMRVDHDAATTALTNALAELARKSGVSLDSIACTCIGTAGNTVSLVTDFLGAEFAARVGGRLLLLGDVEIALDAAFPGQPGILVLAGTGSNVAGRTSAGELLGCGGWGPALADQGSGHRIGLEALRAGFLAKDERRPTTLLNAVMSFWNLTSLDHLIEYANAIPSPDFSRLTEIVLRAALEGDRVAAAVLKREGESLGYLVRLMVQRLQRASAKDQPLPGIAFAGSIMEKVPPVRNALIDLVRSEFPSIIALEGVIDPLDGALWRARRHHPHRLPA